MLHLLMRPLRLLPIQPLAEGPPLPPLTLVLDLALVEQEIKVLLAASPEVKGLLLHNLRHRRCGKIGGIGELPS